MNSKTIIPISTFVPLFTGYQSIVKPLVCQNCLFIIYKVFTGAQTAQTQLQLQ